MKNVFRGLAALTLPALLVTSCAKEVVESKIEDGKAYIGYGIATGKQTAGTRVKEAVVSDLNAGFKVYVNDGTAIWGSTGMYTVSNDGSNWIYNGGVPVLHPGNALYHYTTHPKSLSGAGGLAATNLTANPSFTYVVTDGQEDLIASAASTNNSSQLAATANLTFKHLLSQINFAVKGMHGYRITVSNIMMHDVMSTRTYNFGTNGTIGAWSNTAATVVADYSYTIDATNGGIIDYPTSSTAPTAADNLFSANKAGTLMLMPQSFGTSTTGYFEFDYTIEISPDGTNYYSLIPSGKVKVPLGSQDLAQRSWAPGYRYLYTIYFESPIVIKYNVTQIDPFVDGTGNDVDVDNNGNGETGETAGGDEHANNEFDENGEV